MNFIRFINCILLSLILSVATFAKSSAMDGQPQSVSLIQLIANPAAYHGKFVRVTGYLHDKFEDSALYLSKEDADYLNGKNGVWVNYADKPNLQSEEKTHSRNYFDCKVVLLEGHFNKDGHGHMGLWSGELTSVSRVLEQKRWFDGKVELTKP